MLGRGCVTPEGRKNSNPQRFLEQDPLQQDSRESASIVGVVVSDQKKKKATVAWETGEVLGSRVREEGRSGNLVLRIP